MVSAALALVAVAAIYGIIRLRDPEGEMGCFLIVLAVLAVLASCVSGARP